MKDKKSTAFTFGNLTISFSRECGLLPAKVIVHEFGGKETVLIDNRKAVWSLRLEDGRTLSPRVVSDPAVYDEAGAHCIEFNGVEWQDGKDHVFPGMTASIRHEFFDDGSAFSTAYFMASPDMEQCVSDFQMRYSVRLEDYDEVKWALNHRKTLVDGKTISDPSPKRFLPRGKDCRFEHELLPLIAFNGFRTGGPGIYAEFFVEGGNTLSGRREDNSSSVLWKDGSPEIRWNFQTKPVKKAPLALQWRNVFGWCIHTPPLTRHLPPMTLYHYFDNYDHYPTPETVKAMANSGCDAIILHENWRLDPQNGNAPFEVGRFHDFIRQIHRRHIRAALYVRGNEPEVIEHNCAWFERLSRKNFDGIYMDFGGPFHLAAAPSETWCNGRICFRKHYMNIRFLRERIGKNGLFFIHTGTNFSGLGLNLATGYVSGEGERGMLIRGRLEHEYFSQSVNGSGTMWTAAFPEYSSRRMVPFLAATGQYPHNPLGIQCKTSSLAHPSEPGINDICFRPLWKIWSLFRGETDINIFTDSNSRDIFKYDAECGHYLMVSRDKKRALLVVSNFAKEKRSYSFTLNWEHTGFVPGGKKVWLLAPDEATPGKPLSYTAKKLTVSLEGCGVAGFYFVSGKADFKNYEKPYHIPCGTGKKWLEEISRQKKLREEPPPAQRVILTVHAVRNWGTGYEDSMLCDLYDNTMKLVEFVPDGSFKPVADILTENGKRLFIGDRSKRLDLGKLLGKGTHELAIYTEHKGAPFYSFVEVDLACDGANPYTLKFMNGLEPERAFLHWKTIIE
ncbi:MAG: hypothetical protein BWY31_01545 [Lentisphaerae bacterium ADurb.Bin242]|nr:MAG: hypothetical protein BWY31_01545 [Lentisphaerae bacterium ADurb.Bin242]